MEVYEEKKEFNRMLIRQDNVQIKRAIMLISKNKIKYLNEIKGSLKESSAQLKRNPPENEIITAYQEQQSKKFQSLVQHKPSSVEMAYTRYEMLSTLEKDLSQEMVQDQLENIIVKIENIEFQSGVFRKTKECVSDMLKEAGEQTLTTPINTAQYIQRYPFPKSIGVPLTIHLHKTLMKVHQSLMKLAPIQLAPVKFYTFKTDESGEVKTTNRWSREEAKIAAKKIESPIIEHQEHAFTDFYRHYKINGQSFQASDPNAKQNIRQATDTIVAGTEGAKAKKAFILAHGGQTMFSFLFPDWLYITFDDRLAQPSSLVGNYNWTREGEDVYFEFIIQSQTFNLMNEEKVVFLNPKTGELEVQTMDKGREINADCATGSIRLPPILQEKGRVKLEMEGDQVIPKVVEYKISSYINNVGFSHPDAQTMIAEEEHITSKSPIL